MKNIKLHRWELHNFLLVLFSFDFSEVEIQLKQINRIWILIMWWEKIFNSEVSKLHPTSMWKRICLSIAVTNTSRHFDKSRLTNRYKSVTPNRIAFRSWNAILWKLIEFQRQHKLNAIWFDVIYDVQFEENELDELNVWCSKLANFGSKAKTILFHVNWITLHSNIWLAPKQRWNHKTALVSICLEPNCFHFNL